MIHRIVGIKSPWIDGFGCVPEDAVAWVLTMYPRDRVLRIVGIDKLGRVKVRETATTSAYGACMAEIGQIPPGVAGDCERRHRLRALADVGNGASDCEWESRVKALRGLCTTCNKAYRKERGVIGIGKKPIVNTRVGFRQKSRAHWDSRNMECAVGQYTRTNGTGKNKEWS